MYKSLEDQIGTLAETVNSEIYEQRKYFLGRVLTITDSAIADPEQRKAVKDLIEHAIYEPSYWNRLRGVFADFREANGLERERSDMGVPDVIKEKNIFSK